MNRNSSIAVPAPHRRITEHELFASKVKLAGLMILGVVDLIVIVWSRIQV